MSYPSYPCEGSCKLPKKESVKAFAEYCRHCFMLRLRRGSGNAVWRHSVERLDFDWDLTSLRCRLGPLNAAGGGL